MRGYVKRLMGFFSRNHLGMFWAMHLIIFSLKTVQSFRGSNTVRDFIPKFGRSNQGAETSCGCVCTKRVCVSLLYQRFVL